MSVASELKRRSSQVKADAKAAEQVRLLKYQETTRAAANAADLAATTAAQPLIAGALESMKAAAAGGNFKADIYTIPANECVNNPVKALDRSNARAFTGVARGLMLWALEQNLRIQVEDRDNGKWIWRERDSSKGKYHAFKDKLDGYEEWLAVSVSWDHEAADVAAKRRTEQRQSAKKVDLAKFLDHLVSYVRSAAAKPTVSAETRADVDHHIRWSNQIREDDVESAAISIVAAANALGIRLQDILPR
jgi:hypothetical protein